MPLASREGPPDPTVPLDPDGTASQTVVTMQTALDQQPYIKDTFVNKTAFNPQTYAEEFGMLQRYASGSRIQVTYFLISTPTGGLQRSDAIDQSNSRSALRTSYTQINNFEIVMQGGFKTVFDEVSKETKLTGEALLYPGMLPRMGDEFVTSIGDSSFGIFRITKVERLTYRQGSNHKITFFLNRYASEENISVLRQSVTKECWFDKETYLGDATTLLEADSYRYLKTMRQMRGILIRFYYSTFYDKSMTSIMSPQGTYDPYLVNYLNSKISITESTNRPTQLYPGIQNYDSSLWSRLTDITNRRLTNIQSSFNLVQYRVTRWDVSITALVNRMMISLDNPQKQAIRTQQIAEAEAQASITGSVWNMPMNGGGGNGFMPGDWYSPPQPNLYVSTTPGYIFTMNFYNGNKAAMTPFEFLVYAVIYERRVNDIGDFINTYLNTYTELTLDEKYYFIPLYIWLIDVALDNISAPSNFMT